MHGVRFVSAVAGDQLPVEIDPDAAQIGAAGHGRAAQVRGDVFRHVIERQLAARQHDRNGQAAKAQTHPRGRVRHGVRAVKDQHARKPSLQLCGNAARDLQPMPRIHLRTVDAGTPKRLSKERLHAAFGKKLGKRIFQTPRRARNRGLAPPVETAGDRAARKDHQKPSHGSFSFAIMNFTSKISQPPPLF